MTPQLDAPERVKRHSPRMRAPHWRSRDVQVPESHSAVVLGDRLKSDLWPRPCNGVMSSRSNSLLVANFSQKPPMMVAAIPRPLEFFGRNVSFFNSARHKEARSESCLMNSGIAPRNSCHWQAYHKCFASGNGTRRRRCKSRRKSLMMHARSLASRWSPLEKTSPMLTTSLFTSSNTTARSLSTSAVRSCCPSTPHTCSKCALARLGAPSAGIYSMHVGAMI